ncbi:uncharacterized protein [Littorina saxatilis]|uniref:uncharacterized protein isoform X2 n=1 Tax=Littorina saxatilis TaxID=31220 RepID=UPI0038B55904
MIKLIITAGCLIAACSAQAPGGTLQAMCNMGVMQGGVTDALSDSMGRAARTMMQPSMATNPLAMQTLSGASPQWQCLVNSAAKINPRTRQLDVGATAGVISDYFDTVVELKPFIPFFNPCTTVFCGEKGISPVTVATQIVRSMRMRMPLANNLAKLFGAQASQLPYGTTSNPRNQAPRLPGMGGGMGVPQMGGGSTGWGAGAGTQGGFTRGGGMPDFATMMRMMQG